MDWKTLTIFDLTDPVPHVFRHAPGALKFWSKNHQHHQHPWCNDLIPNSLLLKHHLAQKKRPTGKNVATSAAKHSKPHKFRYPQTSPDQQIPESKPTKWPGQWKHHAVLPARFLQQTGHRDHLGSSHDPTVTISQYRQYAQFHITSLFSVMEFQGD